MLTIVVGQVPTPTSPSSVAPWWGTPLLAGGLTLLGVALTLIVTYRTDRAKSTREDARERMRAEGEARRESQRADREAVRERERAAQEERRDVERSAREAKQDRDRVTRDACADFAGVVQKGFEELVRGRTEDRVGDTQIDAAVQDALARVHLVATQAVREAAEAYHRAYFTVVLDWNPHDPHNSDLTSEYFDLRNSFFGAVRQQQGYQDPPASN